MKTIGFIQFASLLLSLFIIHSSDLAFSQCAPDTLALSIPNPDPAIHAYFGYSVAISRELVVVGEYSDEADAIDRGVAYVLNATSGALVATLNNPAPAADEGFGRSVAISGNVVVVGAFQSDDGARNRGIAYVYNATTGALVATLNNPNLALDQDFGISVAVDGEVAVVGAYGDDAGAVNAGAAHVFNATTGALITTLANPAPVQGDYMGNSVAVSGNVAVVAAYQADAGAIDCGTVYVFDATTGALTATLSNPAPTVSDRFGNSVAIDGNVVVVGASGDDAGAEAAGTAYMFNATTSALIATLVNPAPEFSDRFGFSVAVDGNVAVIGAYQDNDGASNAGQAYVFNAMTGTLMATLNNPTPAVRDNFANSVAISRNVAVVGAYRVDAEELDAGSAYIFTCIPTPRESILAYLLGYTTDPAGLDLNPDGSVDVADLLDAGL